MLPSAIKPGDTIGVISPSNSILEKDKEYIEISKKMFEDLGYKVKFGKYAYSNSLEYSETAINKAKDLNDMFRDKEIKAIFCSKGGFNSNSIFDYVDYDLIKQNPKIICGFSDITSITNVIYNKTGLITFNGPGFKSISSWGETEYSFNEVIKRFQNKNLELGTKEDEYVIIKPGKAEGKLIGGNLSLTTWLASGKYKLNFKDKILFIEELGVESPPGMVSNYLYHLKQNGIFDQIKGIWLGNYEHETNISLEKILLDTIGEEYNFPIIKSNNFGHCDKKTIIPIGIMARIDTEDEEKIRILENCVK